MGGPSPGGSEQTFEPRERDQLRDGLRERVAPSLPRHPSVKASELLPRIPPHASSDGNRPRNSESRLWNRARGGQPHGRSRWRRGRDRGRGTARAAAGADPPGTGRADRLAPAAGAGDRVRLLRQKRALGDGCGPGQRRRDAGRRPVGDRLLLLHPAGDQDGGLRLRRGRQAPGAADGRDPARAARAADPRSRRRRPGGGDLPRRRQRAPASGRRGRHGHPGRPSAAGGRMIAAVRGEVMVRRDDPVVVDAGGVGYRLAVSSETLKAVPATGREIFLHAELIAREDSLALYGFSSEEERDLFRLLISVSGIGPKVAIAALSGGTPRDLLRAIAAGDAKRFQAVPGIGKRTAERIIVELREKGAGALEEEVTGGGAGGDDPRALARDGLVNLGYAPLEAEQLLDGLDGQGTQELIAAALRKAATIRSGA